MIGFGAEYKFLYYLFYLPVGVGDLICDIKEAVVLSTKVIPIIRIGPSIIAHVNDELVAIGLKRCVNSISRHGFSIVDGNFHQFKGGANIDDFRAGKISGDCSARLGPLVKRDASQVSQAIIVTLNLYFY